jgi:hypothetical protein
MKPTAPANSNRSPRVPPVLDEVPAFRFPTRMPRDEAQRLLAQAYGELDAGRLLRQALKRQRDAGYDPPHDVQYACEPALEAQKDGLGVSLLTDILLHEEFEGVDECTEIFEDVLAEALLERLGRLVAKWDRSHKA